MQTQTPLRTSNIPRRATRGRAIFNVVLILALVLSGLGFAYGPKAIAMYDRYQATRPQTEARDGLWTIVATSPVRSVHAVFEDTGNILLMAGTGNNGSLGGKVVTNLPQSDYQAAVFDPRTNSFLSLSATWDVFCGGHVVLPDGNILVAGGTRKYEKIQGDKTISQFEGVRNSAIFDVKTNKWIKTSPLNDARWYPTLVRAGNPNTVIAVSGLNQNGNIDPGVTEEFSQKTLKWGKHSPGGRRVMDGAVLGRLYGEMACAGGCQGLPSMSWCSTSRAPRPCLRAVSM